MGGDGEKTGAEVFIKDPELAWMPARLLNMTGDKATVSVPSYTNEVDIDMGGKGANKWSDRTVSLKDYAEYGKQLPLQNNKVLDDMVDLPYLHEVSVSLRCCRVVLPWLGHSFSVENWCKFCVFSSDFNSPF